MMPEIAPRIGVMVSGKTKRERYNVTSPRANTLMVWVKVTISPRKTGVPRSAPRAYQVGATSVLPCPRRERVHGAERERRQHAEQHHAPADVALVEQTGR
jgi:hypothetical protein